MKGNGKAGWRRNPFSHAVALAAILALPARAGILREGVLMADPVLRGPAVGETIALESFDGKTVSIDLLSRAVSGSGVVSYRGRTSGSTQNNASVVMTGNGFVATVRDGSTGNLLRFRLDGDIAYLREETFAPGGCCGVRNRRRLADSNGALSAQAGKAPLAGDPLIDGAHFLERGETVTNAIDVLVAVDLSAAGWIREKSAFAGETDAVELFAADSIARCNNMYANTDLDRFFSFNLAGVFNLGLDCSKRRDKEGYVDSERILEYVTGDEKPASSDEAELYAQVRDFRDSVHADVVMCLVACGSDDPVGTVGVSVPLNGDTIRDKAFSEMAYGVCLVESVANGVTLAHEIGHVMGAGHAQMADRDNSGPQLYGYSSGYYFSVPNAEGNVFMHAATVMGYDSDGYDDDYPLNGRWGYPPSYADDALRWMKGMFSETEFFSSPNHTYRYAGPDGKEIDSGVRLGDEYHDNTRLLSQTYPLVANFRVRSEKAIGDDACGRFDTAFAKVQTASCVLCDAEGSMAGVVQIKAGRMGKTKRAVKLSASATLVDGTRVRAPAVKLEFGGDGISTATLAFRSPLGEMTFRIGSDGAFSISGAGYSMAEGAVGGEWTGSGAVVSVAADDVSMFGGKVLEDLLPFSEEAGVSHGRWVFGKAARVAWTRPKSGAALPEICDSGTGKGLVVDTSRGKTNLSGMKLAYFPKKGVFKGRFTVYALEEKGSGMKLVKHAVKVSGLVVDGAGVGKATCRKTAASWDVGVEQTNEKTTKGNVE
ncbi:MAG: zinc-dependent metalloprotease [Kiritimatiellae bacterium]|nr:zinc-dependent metalloprotease [Kiritimatiellia bacterium]